MSLVSSPESFVDATSDVYVAVLLVDDYNTRLNEIATATALLVAKIPGRLIKRAPGINKTTYEQHPPDQRLMRGC